MSGDSKKFEVYFMCKIARLYAYILPMSGDSKTKTKTMNFLFDFEDKDKDAYFVCTPNPG